MKENAGNVSYAARRLLLTDTLEDHERKDLTTFVHELSWLLVPIAKNALNPDIKNDSRCKMSVKTASEVLKLYERVADICKQKGMIR